jgi:isoamylase
VRRLILDSLHYWVEEMHVDGFRFDLASILSRDEHGAPLANPPILWDIETDPVLAGVKLIAEAWDAAGLYQVGSFLGDHWKEWNGRFRDDIRAFVKSDRGWSSRWRHAFSPAPISTAPTISARSRASTSSPVTTALRSTIWFPTTRNTTGTTAKKTVTAPMTIAVGIAASKGRPPILPSSQLRQRQVKNFFAVTLLSLGVPMLLMGDEVRRTQHGNNNGYCQDNDESRRMGRSKALLPVPPAGTPLIAHVARRLAVLPLAHASSSSPTIRTYRAAGAPARGHDLRARRLSGYRHARRHRHRLAAGRRAGPSSWRAICRW